jgi:hypothetical protein
MSHPNCPRWEYPEGRIPIFDGRKACWVCDTHTRSKHAEMMPLLPQLYAFLEGNDMEGWAWSWLYEYYSASLPYGALTGDTGSIEEWIGDRPRYIEDLAGEIEGWCIEEKPKAGAA